MSIRPIKRIVQSQPTIEGAGVRLRRAFGFGNTGDFDPFLLLDDFRNEHPEDYLAGFPWHPHRGIETITYVLSGSVQHGDTPESLIASADAAMYQAKAGGRDRVVAVSGKRDGEEKKRRRKGDE